jgi:hypothetical protein
MEICLLCDRGPVDCEDDSSEDDDDTLCSKLEPYKYAAHPFVNYSVCNQCVPCTLACFICLILFSGNYLSA